MNREEWRPVLGWPYEISSMGRVRRKDGRLMSLTRHGHGYLQAWMRNAGKRHKEYVHRLVAFAFLGAPPNPDCHADHINGERADNRMENLRWLTPAQNRERRRIRKGETHHMAKLSDKTVHDLRADRSVNNTEMARRLGVRRETVRDIRLGKERTHAT